MNQKEQEKQILEALVGDRVKLYQTSPSFHLAMQALSKGMLQMVNEAAKLGERELERHANLVKEFERFGL